MCLQAYHGAGSLKAGRSELGYSQAASVAKDSFMEDDALLKDDDPSAPRLPCLLCSDWSPLTVVAQMFATPSDLPFASVGLLHLRVQAGCCFL